MDLRIDLYHHYDPNDPAPPWAAELKGMLESITQKENLMSQEMDNLTAQVTASTTVQDSAMVLLNGLKTALDAAIAKGPGAPAALQALSDSLSAESAKLAAAITANTPAAAGGANPPPPPGPTPAAAAPVR